ncbi:MAG: asparagine synthase (glutamine-hydrolyzing) [Thermodesulfobacteriota bacterium]
MCGIAGICSVAGVSAKDLAAMARAMAHRGPDGAGVLLCRSGGRFVLSHDPAGALEELPGAWAGLSHRRLSILDLSEKSLQPMTDPEGRAAVAFNGEIYNYIELREELAGLGHLFSTAGDTEVLLRAYLEWGPECLPKLRGMFAFAVLDFRKNILLLARDRFGIKPLYIARQNGKLLFASEIKALAAVPGFSLLPDQQTVARYLALAQTDVSERTFFEGVRSFPPACFAIVPLGEPVPEIIPRPYWGFPRTRFAGSPEEAAREFRRLFLDSLRIHLRSDVPVGTCLSGGLDSSSIVCAAHLLSGREEFSTLTHHAFGYVPPDPRFSEEPYMQAVARKTGAKLHLVTFSPEDFFESIPRLVHSQDEPFASVSIAAQWAVFREARRTGVTVMLDGQGADEILAGYHSVITRLAQRHLSQGDLSSFLRLRKACMDELGAFPFSMKNAAAALAPEASRAAEKMLARILPGRSVVRPELLREAGPAPREPLAELSEILRSQVTTFTLPSLLRYEDHNSMAHSIEARVPFLDHRLVELCFSLPDDYRLSGARTKSVLRQGMEGILPPEVLARKDKVGFRSSPGLTFALAEKLFSELSENRTGCEEEWFDKKGVEAALQSPDRSEAAEFSLWRIINVKMWARMFWGSVR